MKKKVCMVVPSFTAKGGITSVVNGYRNSQLTEDYDVRFIETYCDGSVIQKTSKALSAYLKFIYTALFWKPNLVHVHSSFGGSFYRKALIIEIASLSKIPVVNHAAQSEGTCNRCQPVWRDSRYIGCTATCKRKRHNHNGNRQCGRQQYCP